MSHLLLLNVRPVPQAATFSKETIDRYYGPCTDWTRADLILDAVDAEDYGEEREQPETTAIVANLQPGSNRYFRTRCNAVPQVLCLPFLLRYLFAGWYEHVQEVKARIYEAGWFPFPLRVEEQPIDVEHYHEYSYDEAVKIVEYLKMFMENLLPDREEHYRSRGIGYSLMADIAREIELGIMDDELWDHRSIEVLRVLENMYESKGFPRDLAPDYTF